MESSDGTVRLTQSDNDFDAAALSRLVNEGGRDDPAGDQSNSADRSAQARREPDIDPSTSSQESIHCSLNRKVFPVTKPVYRSLAAHQVQERDWEYHDLAALLDDWYPRFDQKFRLNVPRVPLRLDPAIRRNCAGYFLPDHNEFGLVYEIAIAVPPPERLDRIDIGDVLGTLLHEQLHLLQELTGIPGRNNYHNAQYRHTAEHFGLVVDSRGHQSYWADSPFLDLLTEFGMPLPLAAQAVRAAQLGLAPPAQLPAVRQPGKSKLRKWTCGCTNVWVGVAVLEARCTRPGCSNPFRPA